MDAANTDRSGDELSDDDAARVLEILIFRARPPSTERLPDPAFYARELIDIHTAEVAAIRSGRWTLTPWEEVMLP